MTRKKEVVETKIRESLSKLPHYGRSISKLESNMKILIYKRTHKGDPNPEGVFGNQDCMGRIRNWDFHGVIGIGGKAPWKQDSDIKYKINWIGLGPKKVSSPGSRGYKVVFDHFKLYEEAGENIKEKYPNLFRYMFHSRKRWDMSDNLPEVVFNEVQQILNSIQSCPASKAYNVEYMDSLDTEPGCHTSKCRGCFGEKKVEVTVQEC